MKKKLSILLIACMLFSLAACGNSGDGADGGNTEEPQTQTAE